MKLTIIQTGDVPAVLRERFGPYPAMFRRMFDEAGHAFDYETIPIHDGAPFPVPEELQAILITGSAAGVYDAFAWLDPLRAFIRNAYAAGTPMLGICFGHQIMADALGGVVRKSEKGWGLGRHTYSVRSKPARFDAALCELSIACSHQDQVIEAPADAEVFLASDFTPNAGLVYRQGKALSLQPHPEFLDDYTLALAELRRGRAPDDVVERALASVATPSHSLETAKWLGSLFTRW